MKIIGKLMISLLVIIALIVPIHAQEGTIEVPTSITYGQTNARSMLNMINTWRNGGTWYYNEDGSKTQTGALGSLAYDDNLEEIAITRAKQIAILFQHLQPNGESIFNLSANGMSIYGENIAAGTNMDASTAFKLWQEEDQPYSGQGHRRNMLNTEFQSIGIGHVKINGIDCWVQDFSYQSPQSEMKSAARDETVTETLSIPTSQIQSLTIENYYSGSLSSGSSVNLPELKASLSFKDGVITLPVEAQTSYLVSGDIGIVNGQTLTLNQKLGNRNATISAQATYQGYSATKDFNLEIRCAHEEARYENMGTYHKKICALCGEALGNASHRYDAGKVTIAPTVTSTGVKTFTCQDCGATKTEMLAKLPASTKTNTSVQSTPNKTIKKTVVGKKSLTLKAPEKGKTTWISSAKKIATVKKGKVTIKGYGKVTISAQVNGHTYKYRLTIQKPLLKVSLKKVTVKKGKSVKVKVKSNGKVKWSSANKKIAKVKNGKITGVKKGKTTIIVSQTGKKVKIQVIVK